MEETTAAYRVTGLVQGVGFRWWTVRQARKLALRGTVRNAPDGSVEVTAAGTGESIAALHQLLWRGPPDARVDQVIPIPAPASTPASFEIAR